jgi:Uma2 family endonuclease
MVAREKFHTAEEFEQFIARPGNADKLFEWINGEIVEKMPSNPYASEVAQLISFFIRLFLRQHGIAGHVTEGQGGYRVAGSRQAPDVAYISQERQPELARKGYNPNPPELAVEVESPVSAESERRLRAKLFNYLAAGTITWVVYPDTKEVEVYVPDQTMRLLGIDDTLDGGNVLPEFTLAVKEIFP